LGNATIVPLGRRARSSVIRPAGSKLGDVVIFFEALLALAAVAIIAFSLYVVYRLVTDES
jgi:hypothetical protein